MIYTAIQFEGVASSLESFDKCSTVHFNVNIAAKCEKTLVVELKQ